MDKITFISPERLRTYERRTDRQERAVILHNHTLQLGSSIMSMIALLELSLRNCTNDRLVKDFGDNNWLARDSASVPLKSSERNTINAATTQAQKAAYSKLSYKEKSYLDVFAYPSGVPKNASHKNITKRRKDLFVVSHGQIISQTTLYFWKRLYSSDYNTTLWKPSLKRVFPNKKLKRSDISKALEVVYSTRNRVAHHEPVYGSRLAEAMAALDFLRNSLGSKSFEGDSNFKHFSRIQYLRLRMDYETFTEAWTSLTQ